MHSSEPSHAGRIYAANLAGSSVGAVVVPLALSWLGAERAVLLCGVFGAGAALILAGAERRATGWAGAALVIALAFLAVFPPQLELQLSPYKRLSQMLLDPAATLLATHQDATARLDIVRELDHSLGTGSQPWLLGRSGLRKWPRSSAWAAAPWLSGEGRSTPRHSCPRL
jgi:hypothetical protein